MGNVYQVSLEEWRRAITGPVLVITGAGLSADSGLQTFRGAGGLWRNYDPMALATPEAFARDPKLVCCVALLKFRVQFMRRFEEGYAERAAVALETVA